MDYNIDYRQLIQRKDCLEKTLTEAFEEKTSITKPRSLVRPNQSKFRPQMPLVGLGPIKVKKRLSHEVPKVTVELSSLVA
ncbi:hypothetical protein JHK86_052491 [Glycine max]|nr:hypothetical protein JHK86_052491 [Glycine max]